MLLLCRFDGDKNDPCLSTSCNPKKKFSVMIVAIVASTVVFVLVVSLALFFGLRKKKTSSHVKGICGNLSHRKQNTTYY